MIKQFKSLILNPLTFLALILLLGFGVRLYKIDSPVADWHSWRQADTAAVARNFYQDGFNPFLPRYDDMSAVSDPPISNPNRYRFVEFPIYPSLVYFGYLARRGVDERIARLISIFFSLGSVVIIYYLTKDYFGQLTALLAALLFATLPYNIYYSRVILPEPSLVFFSLGALYFTNRWIWDNQKSSFWWSIFLTICALLTKPTAIFFLLPLLYSFYQKEKKLFFWSKRYFFWLILTLLPLFGWRLWIVLHPEGIPASSWLLNGNGIRFKPIFFKWIFSDRFGREILGVTGTVLFFLGFLLKPNLKEGWFLHLLALASFLYLIVFATGNVQHDYYQVLIIPALVILVSRAIIILIKGSQLILSKLITMPLVILFVVMMFYTTWGEIKGLYQINNPAIVEAGQAANQLLPKEAKVVAPYQGDTAFLYQINRKGFAYIPSSLEDLRDKYGVNFLVSVSKDRDTQQAMQKYQVIAQSDKYVIVDLTKVR